MFNPLNAELNPIRHLLSLLGTHPILHISRIRVNSASVNLSEGHCEVEWLDAGALAG